jgi:hypothetical protein
MAATGINSYYLFTNQTTDANSTDVTLNYPNKVNVTVWGTFGGSSIKLQTLIPNTSPEVWIDVPDKDGNTITFTTNKQDTIENVVPNERIRAVLSSASGSTTVNVLLQVSQ